MARLLHKAVFAALIVVASTVGALSAALEKRVALVIGNAQYKVGNISLANPKNDAEDVAAVLTRLGFEVVQAIDANKRDIDLALQRFARAATNADSALFYYAGHAMQYQGRNYLMPVDAELEDEVSLRYNMVAIDDVRVALDRASGVKIMILDACRNNPLADRFMRQLVGATRAAMSTRGLARIDKTQGMVVAYATAADDVAMDGGNGRNSPFTTALIRRMQEPGLEIEMMFRRIASDVNAQTGGRQRPETYISLLSEYYLNQTDRLVWERLRDSGDIVAIREFIQMFPYSVHAWDAKYRLEILERSAREREDAARLKRERENAERAEAQRRAIEERLQKLEAERKRTNEAAEQEAARQREAQERLAREEMERQRVERERLEQEAAAKREEETRLARIAAEQKRLAEEETKRLEAEKRAGQARLEAEKRQREEDARRIAAEQKRLAEEDAQRAEAAKRVEQERIADEKRKQEEEAKRLAAEQKRLADEEAKRAEAAKRAEQERVAAEKRKQEEEAKRLAAEQKRLADEQAKRVAAEKRKQEEEARRVAAEQKAEAARVARAEAEKKDAQRREEEAARKREAEEKKRQAAEQLARLEAERLQAQKEARERELAKKREDEERRKMAAACKRDHAGYDAVQGDLGKLQAFVTRISCEELKAAAQERVAALTAQRDLEEKTCKHDAEEFALLQAAGNKEKMAEFQKKLGCEQLRPTVVAALSKLDATAAAPAEAARALVRDTQTALRRIGCFKGDDNGELNDATKAAIKQFLSHSDHDEAAADPSADLLKEIKAAPADTCPLTCAAGQVARGGSCVAERPAKPPVRAERARPQHHAVREKPAREKPARQRAERPAPAVSVRAEAPPRPSGGSSAPRAIGVGF